MFIEEKLALLKQELSKEDFTIRYTDFKSIMSKIEAKFFSSKNPSYKYNNWDKRLEGFSESSFSESTFDYLGSTLKNSNKYWWIYVDSPCYSNSRHRLFDATLVGGERLSYLFSDSPIYIVHKKYDWMMVLDRSRKIIKEQSI